MIAGLSGVEQHAGMQVPVSGVEDVGDGDPVALTDLVDLPQHLRQAGSWNHAVNEVVVGRYGPERAEGRLAAHPEAFPFGVVLGDPHVGGSGIPQGCFHLSADLFDLFVQALQFDQQDRAGVVGVPRVGDVLDRLDAQRIDHLQGGGDDTVPDHR